MVTVLCGVAFHIKWNIILWISIRPVLPMVASEKMLQVLSLWLGSAVPPSEKLENPVVFSFLSGTSRLFLELFQGVGTYVFLLAVTNNSSESFHHLIWFWGAYQSSGCLEFTDYFFLWLCHSVMNNKCSWNVETILFPENIYDVYSNHSL